MAVRAHKLALADLGEDSLSIVLANQVRQGIFL
jgi:hypothetical protein